MGTLDLTVKVLDFPPRVTLSDLNSFFSYCGTIEAIHLQSNKDQAQLALVTFTQPYAFQTALLLNGATMAGVPIRVLALRDDRTPPASAARRDIAILSQQNNERQGVVPAVHAAIDVMASKGIGLLNKTKDELEESLKLSAEKGKELAEHTIRAISAAQQAAISAAQQAASHLGTGIRNINNECVSSGALWLSTAQDQASKQVSKQVSKKRPVNPDNARVPKYM